jgi:hypothetical protein
MGRERPKVALSFIPKVVIGGELKSEKTLFRIFRRRI